MFQIRTDYLRYLIMVRLLSILFITALFSSSYSYGQDLKSRFFLGLASSQFIDYTTSPLQIVQEQTGVDPNPADPDNPFPRYEDVPYQSASWSMLSVGLEPRFNVYEVSDDLAFAMSVPLSLGIGQSGASNDDVSGASGFGSFQADVLAKVYFGSGSTYSSESDFGVSLGGGIEYNKLALINQGNFEQKQYNKGWVMPVVSGSVHFWRGSSPLEVNLKYGFGEPRSYSRDKFGSSIATRTTNAFSFKLSFIYLVNY